MSVQAVFLALLAAFALGWTVSSRVAARLARTPGNGRIRRDTLVLRDTLRIDNPVEVERWRVRRDTILVSVARTDTVVVGDTIFLAQPREAALYEGADYRAQVSGIAPRLDWVEVRPVTTVVTERVRASAPRVSAGVQAGLGVQYGLAGGRWDAGPYIGLGIQLRF